MPTQVPKIEIHDEQARIVKGFGTVDVFDNANERLPIEEFKRLMPVIMKRGGLIMNKHTNQSVAKILNYEFRMKDTSEGPKEGVYLTTEVFKDFGSDDQVWEDIKKGNTEGFSFGGKNNREELDFSKGLTKKVLKELEGFEFSYVPKGCNKEATIEEINYIAKEDKTIEKEDGETSTDSDHYHLYRIDESGEGKTLGTLPRETEEHTHQIKSGIVTLENGHTHELVRMLVNKAKVFLKPGQQPPAGASVQTGPRGGRFFESGVGQKPQEQPREKPSEQDAQEDVRAEDTPEAKKVLEEIKSLDTIEILSPETDNKIAQVLFGKDDKDLNDEESNRAEDFFFDMLRERREEKQSKIPFKAPADGKFTEEEILSFKQDLGFNSKIRIKGKGDKEFFVSPISVLDPRGVQDGDLIPISNTPTGARTSIINLNDLLPPKDFEVQRTEKESHTDDKVEKIEQSKYNLTLLHSDNKADTFIKKGNLIKNMAEDENKKPTEEKKVDKVEEAPMAADSTPTEDPITVLSAKMDKIIELLSVNKVEEPEEVNETEKGGPGSGPKPFDEAAIFRQEKDEEDKVDKKEEDKDKDVEKEGDGEQVKLPESEGDEVSQDKPAEGAVSDESKANFLEKIKADITKDIMKGLLNNKADTPRPAVKSNDIKKTDFSAPKTSLEANKMIKAAGLQ